MINDEELQRKIEENGFVENSVDATVYKKIFEGLSKEAYRLPENFSDSVVRRVESRNSFVKDHLWLGLGLVCLFAAGLVTTLWLNITISFGSFRFISGYYGLFLFGLIFILAFQWADKKVFHKHARSLLP